MSHLGSEAASCTTQMLAGSGEGVLLAARVEHILASLRGLAENVRAVESRQVSLDRRLVECSSLLQGMQEEQYTQSKALAFGAQRALDTAVTVQKQMEQEDEWHTCFDEMSTRHIAELEKEWEARFREQGQRLMDLSAEVAGISFHAPGEAAVHAGSPEGAESSISAVSLVTRLQKLERGQRAVAVSVRRALQTAILVHQHQQSQELHEGAADDSPIAKPLADLEAVCLLRLSEQEERIERVLQLVDALADKVLQAGQAQLADAGEGAGAETCVAYSGLRDRLDGLEAHVYGLAEELQQRQAPGVGEEGVLAAMAKLEDRIDRSVEEGVLAAVAKLEGKMDQSVEEALQRVNSQRVQLRKVSNQLPEMAQKLDQLWAQCQDHFPRIQEHEVNFSYFRASFESQKQQMLDLAELLEVERRGPGTSA